MASEKKQITRNRTSYSCQMCRRRKVRCDKKHPRCGGCIKTDETCVYGDSDQTSHDSVRQSPIAHRLLPRKRRATNDNHEDADLSGTDQTPFPVLQSVEQKLIQLTSLVRELNRQTPDSTGDSRNSHGSHSVPISRPEFEAGNNSSVLELQEGITSTEPFGSSNDREQSWNKILEALHQINNLLKVDERTANHPNTLNSGNTVLQRPHIPRELPADSWKPILNHDMIAPSETEFAVLFRSWLWSIYPVLPIISPHIVLNKYRAFRQWYVRGLDRGEPNPDLTFMPYLILIWHAGFENLSEKAKQKWLPWTSNNPFWNRGLRTWLETELDGTKMDAQSSIYSLAAAVTAHYLGIGGQDMMKSHSRNLVNLRTAQNLGLHNERALKDLSVAEAETRRRLWWEALSMDASISTVSGMPVILDGRYTDTKMISELKDCCMNTTDAQEYEAYVQESGLPDRPDDPANWQNSSLVSVYHLVARARHVMTAATKRVLKANMSAEPMTMDQLKAVRKSIQQAGDDIREIINRIQSRGIPELDFVPETMSHPVVDHLDDMGEEVTPAELDHFLRYKASMKSTNPIMKHHRATTIAFHKWARIMLSMTIDRLECISYAPFLKKSKSRLWAVARNCALRSCHAYMRKFLSLAEDPELRAFRWTWTSTFHPMHATIIMLVDVHDRPHSDEAPRSRAMIDKMFSLMCMPKFMDFPQYGTTNVLPLREGGEEARIMLRKLRHKAWQNAGLDPDVLWTEEDQMAVGVGKSLKENDLFIRSLREDIILHRKEREGRKSAPQFTRASFEAIRKQRLHPSDVGNGDQVIGSVVRDVEDFERFTMIPQILLLRARNDQELMPYPVTGRHQEIHPTENSQKQEPFSDNSTQTGHDKPTLNIGDLIRKIQQTKRAGSSEHTTPAHRTVPEPSTETLTSKDELPNAPQCDFRTLRSVENAAYQDIVDGNSIENVSLQAPNTREHQVSFAHFPTARGQSVEKNADLTNSETPLVHGQQALLNDNTTKSFTEIPSTEAPVQVSPVSHPSIQLQGPNGSNPETFQPLPKAQLHKLHQNHPQGQTADPNAHPVRLQATETSTRSTIDSEVKDVTDTNDFMDIDFDWDRWDEMFGQFDGYGDLLMEGFDHDVDFD